MGKTKAFLPHNLLKLLFSKCFPMVKSAFNFAHAGYPTWEINKITYRSTFNREIRTLIAGGLTNLQQARNPLFPGAHTGV